LKSLGKENVNFAGETGKTRVMGLGYGIGQYSRALRDFLFSLWPSAPQTDGRTLAVRRHVSSGSGIHRSRSCIRETPEAIHPNAA
jgi:hypothetical protein